MNFSWLLKRCVCFVLTIFNSFFLPVALCKSPLAGYSNEFSYKFVSNHQKSQWSEKREKDNIKSDNRRVTISIEKCFQHMNSEYQKKQSGSKFLAVIQIRSETIRGLYFFQTLRELLELSLFQPKKEFGMYLQKILWNYECLYLKLRQRQSEVVVKLTSNFLNSWFAYITLFTSTKLSTKLYKTFLKVKRLLYSIHFLIQRSFSMHLYNDIHIMAKSPVLGNEMKCNSSYQIVLI